MSGLLRPVRRRTSGPPTSKFHAREGHLQPSREAVEIVDGVERKIGTFQDNARGRADKLSPERRAEPDALGMRW